MKIALVSDSHGRIDRLKILLERLQEAHISVLFHAGDFAVYGVREVLEQFPEIRIFISQGNCDVNREILSEVSNLPNVVLSEIVSTEIDGVRIGMSHYPRDAQKIFQGKDIHLFFCGHTHHTKMEQQEGVLILNPGALEEDGRYFLIDVATMKIEQKVFSDVL